MPTSSPALTPREQLDAPEAGRVALKFFFSLMEHWGCSVEQQRTLLGGVGNTTFYKYNTCQTHACPMTPSSASLI